MKHITVFFVAIIFLFGCSSGKKSPQTRRYPGSHIMTKDKKVIKDNLKYKKEHAKAARKKREELAVYLYQNNLSTHDRQGKKSRKETHY